MNSTAFLDLLEIQILRVTFSRQFSCSKMKTVTLMVSGIFLLSNLDAAAPAKILFVYPVPTASHYTAFIPLIEELARRGHEVTAYTVFKGKQSIPNYKEILITLGEPAPPLSEFKSLYLRWKNKIFYINYIRDFFTPMTESFLRTKEFKDLLQSKEKYDLVIVEALFSMECLLALGHRFNAPVVNYNALFLSPWVAQLLGQPHSFSYIPDFRLPYTDQINFWGRIHNTAVGMYEILAGNFYHLPIHEELMRKYFKYPGSETLPTLRELIQNISITLVDSHTILNSVRPYSPNVVDVAGIQTEVLEKLPQDLQKFMDDAKEGVVFFSFGSIIDSRSFPVHWQQMLVETMKSLKYKVIWRWHEKVDGADHILSKSWLPQKEILAHPNCKLFITHGGYNGMMEAQNVGIPVIGMPFFSDQYHDFKFYEQYGLGFEVDFDTMTAAEFRDKINHVIQTPSYQKNAKKLANYFHDLPQTSLEKSIFWVEYVIRHNGAHHLRPAAVDMPYYQYLLIDVIAFFTISVLAIVFIFVYFVRKFLSLIVSGKTRSSRSKTRNKKQN
uniref:UDP-gluconosyltransferase n=1 Tax=Trialeurodes vaporariorum TaxID=88556 RepID=A0A873P537_TRIVP|nr:UDP-gluconosyltransferase [Trialeurodes vaporariorum]